MVGSGKVSDLDQYSTDGILPLYPCSSPSVPVHIQSITGMYQHMTWSMTGSVSLWVGRMSISSCISLWRHPHHVSTDLMLSKTCSGMT
jgi:hypothetical protein